MKLVLDCDPGLDDAVAILVAAHHADLIGITTVAGNVGINRTTRNALVVAQLAGLDVPVHRGAAQPLAGAAVDGSRIHGETGLGDAALPELTRSEASDDAVAYICDTARSVDDLHLLAIGPLTNVALALRRDPDLRQHLASLTIMGGGAHIGNITPVAEFNIWADPEAAAVVFEKAAPVTMVGLDVTNKVVFGTEETTRMRAGRRRPGTPAAELAADVTDFLRDRFRRYVGQSVVPLHDATARHRGDASPSVRAFAASSRGRGAWRDHPRNDRDRPSAASADRGDRPSRGRRQRRRLGHRRRRG